jgi:CRISPR-associated protein Cas1
MKHLLNTLYVTTQGAYLHCDGETVAVDVEHETKLRVPLHTLDGVVCFGRVTCTPPLMQHCAEHGVSISFLSERGRFWARVQGPVSGNVLLRREQYRRADDASASAALARAIVAGKIMNARTVLQRALRDHPGNPETARLERAVLDIGGSLTQLGCVESVDQIRGCEGNASRVYFDAFDALIVAQKEDFAFQDRSRRPPLDNMNALLSFLYTLLVHDAASALEGVGLDPAVGFLHRDRPGRASLALDLMEELRPVIADRLALSLVNRQQVKGSGFTASETGAVMMDDETRKTVLVAYQERKQEELRHPFLDESLAVGLLPHAQALLLARCLRGDLDGYPPFLWK